MLAARVAGGTIHRSPRDTFTFSAGCSGPVELAGLFPAGGEVRPDGSVETDRTPYRLLGGGLSAIVVRWAPGTDPRAALESVAARDAVADYHAAVRGPAPASVVRAWLISVSFFQGGEGNGEFGHIELVDGDRVVGVL
ncbi:MAG: hypothetical protein QOF76_5448 [Solirubrobacteraceae bacterium]|nr:hypothetical protein [Solirubrobacteraceae bacterium]